LKKEGKTPMTKTPEKKQAEATPADAMNTPTAPAARQLDTSLMPGAGALDYLRRWGIDPAGRWYALPRESQLDQVMDPSARAAFWRGLEHEAAGLARAAARKALLVELGIFKDGVVQMIEASTARFCSLCKEGKPANSTPGQRPAGCIYESAVVLDAHELLKEVEAAVADDEDMTSEIFRGLPGVQMLSSRVVFQKSGFRRIAISCVRDSDGNLAVPVRIDFKRIPQLDLQRDWHRRPAGVTAAAPTAAPPAA